LKREGEEEKAPPEWLTESTGGREKTSRRKREKKNMSGDVILTKLPAMAYRLAALQKKAERRGGGEGG